MKTKNITLLALAMGAAIMAGAAAVTTGDLTAVLAADESPAYTLTPTSDSTYMQLNELLGTYAGTFDDDGLYWNYFSDDFRIGVISNDYGLGLYGPDSGTFRDQTISFTLFSGFFQAAPTNALISRVDVAASYFYEDAIIGNFTDASLQLYVNGSFVNEMNLTQLTATYQFDLEDTAYGSIELVFSGVLDGVPTASPIFYLKGIDVYADASEAIQSLAQVVQQLEEIKTCDITAGDSVFGNFITNFDILIQDRKTTLAGIYIRDYDYGDTEYAGYRVIRVSFMDKYNACLERYNGSSGASSLAVFSNGAGTTAAAVCALLAAAIAAGGLYLVFRKKRAA